MRCQTKELSVNSAVEKIPTSLTEQIRQDVPLEVLRLVTRSALVAVCYSMVAEAQTIAEGLRPHFADYLGVAMAQATVLMAGGRHGEALEVLDDLARRHPDADAIVCACAMLKKEFGVSGWRALAQRVVDRDADVQAVTMAQEMLGTTRLGAGVASLSAAQATLRFA
jgi:predicted Zn-dependent protease